MKKLFVLFSLVFFTQIIVKAQDYEETIRQYVLEKLVFYYVHNLDEKRPVLDKNLSNFEVDKVSVANNQNITSPLWSSPGSQGLKSLMIKLLRSAANGGDLRLQKTVANVLLISDKKIYVFLYNDIPNVVPHKSWEVYCTTTSYPTAHNNASWPCARSFDKRNLPEGGEIGIGAYFFDTTGTAGGWSSSSDKMHVFIHELVHTQIPLTLEHSLGNVSMYGNGGHSFNELIPSKNSAFNEGIATAFALRYFFPGWMDLSNWYNTNKSVFVDNISGCGSPTPPHCLQSRLATLSVPILAGCSVNTKCYSIRNIPPTLIPYTENTTANILFQYMNQFNSEMMLVRDIKNAIKDMNNSTIYTFLPLFKEMVKSGKSYQNLKAPSGSAVRGHLLTLGILDYYAGYKVDDLGSLNQFLDSNYEGFPNPQNYRDYFSMTGSQELRKYRTNNTTWDVQQQLDRFALFLNVRTDAPATTSPTGK